jgi:hypothetical protein
VHEAARIVEGEGSSSLPSAWLAILLTALGTIFTLVHTNLSIFGLRPQSVTLLLIWIAGTRLLFSRQQSYPNAAGVILNADPKELSRRKHFFLPMLVLPLAPR